MNEININDKQREFFEHIYKVLEELDSYIIKEECIDSDDECFEFASDVCETLNDVMYWIDGLLHGNNQVN